MLYRKITAFLEEHLRGNHNKILIVDGARQIGKSYIIRYVGETVFPNYIEINLLEDASGPKMFSHVHTVEDFYLQISMLAGEKMGNREDTLIFLDEIQEYPHLLTLLKFLKQDNRYTYIASGSQLGICLAKTTSIPMGSIEVRRMYPLDFEEFLYANGWNHHAVQNLREKFQKEEALDETTHQRMLDLFRKYLLVGGLPDAVNTYLNTRNIVEVRRIQQDIHGYYGLDATKYESNAGKKLQVRRIYDMIPSTLENKKKRIVIQDIEEKKGKRYRDYEDEFEYLIASGITLSVNAISNPAFPLLESGSKNLLKLYLNDVGILTGLLYRNNIRAIMDDVTSINLGTVYESVVAQELKAHGFSLFYYDNRNKGEVDFLIDDDENLSVLPLEIKSGKDYTRHSALNHFVNDGSYAVNRGIVFSNEREIFRKGNIIYMPIYYVMFLAPYSGTGAEDILL